MDDKYVVFKREDWLRNEFPQPLEDAVVIRRQDKFAPPALDCYANAITMVVEAGNLHWGARQRLQQIADYFHDQAAKAWTESRKLPD